ncbi:ParD-like family protein [Pseudoalteromonas arctica]|uniref:ParD-like family protein n=1 Tax=Pseudoalteromonas arctica TaxID=394751 RepID=A0A7Y0HCR8_9GAMM|nr:ParD-like family protein [Pseudoalteromonas arctica]NMM40374.1 ParD-like family protein [Pseudoalteromonas arctica]
MGIVKISDQLHEEIRKASTTMVRSINSQSEYWIKIGMLAELNPTMTYAEIIKQQLVQADVQVGEPIHE